MILKRKSKYGFFALMEFKKLIKEVPVLCKILLRSTYKPVQAELIIKSNYKNDMNKRRNYHDYFIVQKFSNE